MEPESLNCSIEFFGDVGYFITFGGGEDNVEDDEDSFSDTKLSKPEKRGRDYDGQDGDKKGDSEDSDSAGEFKKIDEQKVVWKELKAQIKGVEFGGQRAD
jgi:hypothetical protein